MLNFYQKVIQRPDYYRQFSCGESLITIYNCPLENRYVDLWAKHNYIVYVTEGKKIWYTGHHSYTLEKGNCIFVRRGANIVEQFFDTPFCLLVFFITDEFICENLKARSQQLVPAEYKKHEPVIRINNNDTLLAFYQSMTSYFNAGKEPDKALLELKFRELVLTLADDRINAELLAYFHCLLQEPKSVSMRRIMEDNYCFNLRLEEYATLCNRSLSAFKRDFQKYFSTTPGKWLLERKLEYAYSILRNTNKTVREAAFESGFENPSHFSRCFKERFHIPPLVAKQQKIS